MTKIEEAQDILRALGLPAAQSNEMSALTLLALGNLAEQGNWADVQAPRLTVTKGIMEFVASAYGRRYAPNTRETFRRQVLHQFIQASIVALNPDTPDLPTNSPHTQYALTEDVLSVVQTYGTSNWQDAVEDFISRKGSLLATYRRGRARHSMPIQLADGSEIQLSPGQHNLLQAEVIEQFKPHFAPNAHLLYLGDTAKKNLHMDIRRLAALGIRLTDHDKLPDVVLHDTRRRRLFLIEVVTSHGPVSPKRRIELEALFANSRTNLIFVTAFFTRAEYRKHEADLAWETEIWIADHPDHLIHYNGDRFLS